MSKSPELLAAWLESKNAPPTELPFISLFRTYEELNVLVQALQKFTVLKPSYSDGIKVLELIAEIVHMPNYKNSTARIFEKTDATPSWIKHLTEIRYPLTKQRDQNLEKKMLSLPWPYGSKVKFERRGDRAGVELKMFITSEADLVKAVSALERVQTELQK